MQGEIKMKVTDVRVRLIESENRLRALVTVTFDDCFVVHDIRIIEGESGLFIAMPSKKLPNGTFKDIAHPINAEIRKHIEDEIIKAYNAAVLTKIPK